MLTLAPAGPATRVWELCQCVIWEAQTHRSVEESGGATLYVSFDKEVQVIQWGQVIFFNKWCWK